MLYTHLKGNVKLSCGDGYTCFLNVCKGIGHLVNQDGFKGLVMPRVLLFISSPEPKPKENIMTKFKNLLQNHRASFNQTWHEASLGEENSSLFK